MWDALVLAEAAARAIGAEDARLRAEQAVYGLDRLDEVGLHPLLAAGMRAAGWGVWREQPYPGVVLRRARLSERERCDLVLTEDPAAPPLDPVAELKAMDLASGTLFEPVAEAMAVRAPFTEVGEAYWLEVKAVAQFTYRDGAPGPNASYAAELVAGPTRDAVKIASEPMIRAGGVLVVLFTADAPTAAHDVGAMAHRMLDRGAPIGAPVWVSVPVADRIGNAVCTAAVVPVRL